MLGSVASRVAPSPSGGSGSFLHLGPSRGGHAGIFSFYSMPALFHFGNPTTYGGLGVECLQPSLDFSVSYVFPPLPLVPLVLSKFLPEHLNGQLRYLILVVPCWMEAPWLPTVLNMLADVPRQCPIIKRSCHGCFGRPGTQGSAISGFNPLAAQQHVLCRQGFLFLSLSGGGGGNSNIYIKGLPAVLERMGQMVCLTGFTKQWHLCP